MRTSENKNSFCVYVHVFPNGKQYVGLTGNVPENRWYRGLGYRTSPAMNNAILHFGWNSVTHIVLLRGLDFETAEKVERLLIKERKTTQTEFGYNLSLGGGSMGRHTKETKEKMRLAHVGKTKSVETRKKISAALRGRSLSAEHREQLRLVNIGKTHSLESRTKMSIASRKRPWSAENRAKGVLARRGKRKPLSEEHRKKISESLRRNRLAKTNRGIENR